MKTQISVFWWRVLIVAVLGTALFGVSLIALPGLTQPVFNSLYFGQAESPYGAAPQGYIFFMQGILGAVTIGWMVAMLPIILIPFRRGEGWAWWTVTLSVGVWFVVDNAFSVVAGYPTNLIPNFINGALFALPLIATYRQFFPQGAVQPSRA